VLAIPFTTLIVLAPGKGVGRISAAAA
jgi:hypothetical protein